MQKMKFTKVGYQLLQFFRCSQWPPSTGALTFK